MEGILPYAYFNGEIVPIEQANVSIATHALQYGTGVFGGIRGYLSADGKHINIFRVRDHFQRLIDSARLIRIALPTDIDGLTELAVELTRRNEANSNVYFRPYAYKSGTGLTPMLKTVADGFAMFMLPLNEFYKVEGGLSVMVSSWQRIRDVAIPARGKISGSYINSSLAKDEAMMNGFDEAIMLNEQGKVSEGSASNLFLVRRGTLITTPVFANVLEGITRRTVLQLAADLDIPAVEREVDRSELYLSDELFFCGTGVQITPIRSVDHRPIGDGSGEAGAITTALRSRFRALVRGELPKYQEWLTSVPVNAPVAVS